MQCCTVRNVAPLKHEPAGLVELLIMSSIRDGHDALACLIAAETT